jgi:DUF2950 family protein
MLIARLRRMALAVAACVILTGGTARADQHSFATPEAALKALVEALGAAEPAAIADLFGSEHLNALLGDDPVAARADLHNLHEAAKDVAALRPDGADRFTVVIGRVAWPLPIPLVHEPDGWRFDTMAGVDEIADRRVGRDELAAIAVLRAYVDAQHAYASESRGGDGVLEYAQRLVSTGGRRDGLYWPTVAGETPSPFGPFVADAGASLAGKAAGDPYRGYYFRILTRQGPQAPGGAYDYVNNGHMVAGFALLAWPAEYGDTGVMSFLVGPDGIVLESDLGPETAARAGAMVAYDPDPSWHPTAD